MNNLLATLVNNAMFYLFLASDSGCTIDMERKNILLMVCYVPATSATFLAYFSFFLLWPLTVLMKQTRQAVCAIKQSILLRCLWTVLGLRLMR